MSPVVEELLAADARLEAICNQAAEELSFWRAFERELDRQMAEETRTEP